MKIGELSFEEQTGADIALRYVLAWSKDEQCSREDVEMYIEELLAELDPDSALAGTGDFHMDACKAIGSRIRASKESAAEFWSALANVGWFHESQPEQEVSYSFRAAGGLIAQIRGEGDYLDWYCSGPYAIVAPWIAEAMASKGWKAES